VHGHFGADGWFGFGAFGFLSCVAMVVFAKLLGLLVKRPESYYRDAMIEIVIPPALIMLLGGALLAVSREALRPVIALAPAADAVRHLAGARRHHAHRQLPRLRSSSSRAGRRAGCSPRVRADGLRRRAVRLPPGEVVRAGRGHGLRPGAIGVSFAGDLIVMFLFWELMALFSVVVVWCGGTLALEARRHPLRHHAPARRHPAEGGHRGRDGAHRLDRDPALALDNFDAWLVLIGILVNAAAPPLSPGCPTPTRVLADGLGVPVGLHHQDGGAGADAAVPRRASC
jgi:multicomponent Na+:H+ antiporter subunit D